MYESEDSSVASSSFGDQDEMEHFMNRCSICFDAQLDLCLEYCRDQYCLDCFQKYIYTIWDQVLHYTLILYLLDTLSKWSSHHGAWVWLLSGVQSVLNRYQSMSGLNMYLERLLKSMTNLTNHTEAILEHVLTVKLKWRPVLTTLTELNWCNQSKYWLMHELYMYILMISQQ